jgi:hypothetical protein
MRAFTVTIVMLFSALMLCNLAGFFYGKGSSEDKWAVLLEMNDFPAGYVDLPVDFINSKRLKTALISLGWHEDHIHVVNGNLETSVVLEAVEWLMNNSDADDVCILYIFTHGSWMRNALSWNVWFPNAWKPVESSKKVLLIDTCSAEEFLEPLKNYSFPHISLGGCSTDEAGWTGVEEEGLPIIGSVWNYYFTDALCNSSADLDENGVVSIEEAFNFSTPLVQRYMNQTVFAVPEFLESYHAIGIHPEEYESYPHPVMDDCYPDQMVVPEFSPFCILSLFMIAILFAASVHRVGTARCARVKLSQCKLA